MALLTIGTVDRDGLTLAAVAAAAGGDEVNNDGTVFLYINNADASSTDVTAVTQIKVDDEDVADKTITVGASDDALFGPFPKETYDDANDRVKFTYSKVTSLTVQALKLTTA